MKGGGKERGKENNQLGANDGSKSGGRSIKHQACSGRVT